MIFLNSLFTTRSSLNYYFGKHKYLDLWTLFDANDASRSTLGIYMSQSVDTTISTTVDVDVAQPMSTVRHLQSITPGFPVGDFS